ISTGHVEVPTIENPRLSQVLSTPQVVQEKSELDDSLEYSEQEVLARSDACPFIVFSRPFHLNYDAGIICKVNDITEFEKGNKIKIKIGKKGEQKAFFEG